MRRIITKQAASRLDLEDSLWRLDLVYYVRRKGAVKIGYTNSLAARLRKLGCGWPDVIAVEFGDRTLERQRHGQFAELRIQGEGFGVEHYREAEPLVAHMDDIMRGTVALIRGTAA